MLGVCCRCNTACLTDRLVKCKTTGKPPRKRKAETCGWQDSLDSRACATRQRLHMSGFYSWNVADLRTKALAKQRVMLLLHEIGVHAEFGQRQVGQEEFDHQWSRHGEGRQLSKLAKAIARIILVMGLEPTAGAEISGSDGEQCSMDASPNDASEGNF